MSSQAKTSDTLRSLGSAREANILADVLVAVSALPDTMCWRSNSGLFRTLDGRRHVRANLPGIGDVTGIRRGRGFVIETKTLEGVAQATQRNFRSRWEAAGGVYIIARSAEQAVAAVEAIA